MKTEMNTVKVRKTEELEAEQLGAHIGEIVRLHGSIYKIRKMSSFAFVLLRTKRQMVQCVYEPAYARFALEELKEEDLKDYTPYVGSELDFIENLVLDWSGFSEDGELDVLEED